MRNISFKEIALTDGFWKKRYDLNKNVSINAVYERFEETGRFDALRFNYDGSKPLHIFFDSDAAKWIEAAAYLLQKDRDSFSGLETVIDGLIDSMKKNQSESGYLNSYFLQKEPDSIFTRRDDHELYCAGHLIEAAAAYFEATGKREFLDIVCKYADYIEHCFITQKTAKFFTSGHEEIELALIKLFKVTGEERYFKMSEHFLKARGLNPNEPGCSFGNAKYTQNDIPVYQINEAVGHAVRAVYLYTAMSEYAAAAGDYQMIEACKRILENIKTKMYITGGIGSARMGESFTVPYDLPNLTAYSESCAAIGLMFFCLSMQKHEINSLYPDIIERVMYNSLLSSVSLEGDAFFYENPLEVHLASVNRETSVLPEFRTVLPPVSRKKVFGCSCCPPNINRIMASLGDYIFSENKDCIFINQYISCSWGSLKIKTDYPLTGKVIITAKDYTKKEIALRKPFWTDFYTVEMNGMPIKTSLNNGFIIISASKDFNIEIDFNIKVKLIYSDSRVTGNCGRVAVMRGPVVYCLESVDNGENLHALAINGSSAPELVQCGLSPFPGINIKGLRELPFDDIYTETPPKTKPVEMKFIPYYTFANRGEADMLVWVRYN